MSERIRSLCLLALLTTPLALLIASCGSGGNFVSENKVNRGYNPGVGPFDTQGNYVERWADDQRKGSWWRKSSIIDINSVASNTTPVPKPTVTNNRPNPPRGTSLANTPRPKPKPTVTVKPKRKAPIRHTIKKGDTLWALSRKYNTTVTAIQRANGIKGTNLKIGRRLLIPRY